MVRRKAKRTADADAESETPKKKARVRGRRRSLSREEPDSASRSVFFCVLCVVTYKHDSTGNCSRYITASTIFSARNTFKYWGLTIGQRVCQAHFVTTDEQPNLNLAWRETPGLRPIQANTMHSRTPRTLAEWQSASPFPEYKESPSDAAYRATACARAEEAERLLAKKDRAKRKCHNQAREIERLLANDRTLKEQIAKLKSELAERILEAAKFFNLLF